MLHVPRQRSELVTACMEGNGSSEKLVRNSRDIYCECPVLIEAMPAQIQ